MAEFLTIVTREQPGDGSALPRWAGGSDVVMTAEDGMVDTIPVPAVDSGYLDPEVRFEFRLAHLSGRLYITATRCVVVCRRFESKGGGWFGFGWGAVFAAVANLVSKARVAARGAGRAAVGHIRHEQLVVVGWRSTAAGGAANEVRLVHRRPDAPHGVVDLGIPSDLDPALVAVEIVRRAARHRLEVGGETAPELVELADWAGAVPRTSGFATTRFPDPPGIALAGQSTTAGSPR